MKLVFSFLLALITITGCNSTKKLEQNLNSWLGHSKQELILKWGPPNQTTSDGSNGEILVYTRHVYYVLNNNPVDYWEYRMMYADAGGKIYHWLFRRNPNPPNRVDVRLL